MNTGRLRALTGHIPLLNSLKNSAVTVIPACLSACTIPVARERAAAVLVTIGFFSFMFGLAVLIVSLFTRHQDKQRTRTIDPPAESHHHENESAFHGGGGRFQEPLPNGTSNGVGVPSRDFVTELVTSEPFNSTQPAAGGGENPGEKIGGENPDGRSRYVELSVEYDGRVAKIGFLPRTAMIVLIDYKAELRADVVVNDVFSRAETKKQTIEVVSPKIEVVSR